MIQYLVSVVETECEKQVSNRYIIIDHSVLHHGLTTSKHQNITVGNMTYTYVCTCIHIYIHTYIARQHSHVGKRDCV